MPNGVNSSDGGSDSQVFLFLHENMIVTTGVFADEDIVFDAVTNEWIEFCTNVLEFRVPDDIANARRETPVGVSHP